ncbi:hypothetical protein [Parvicella tangerina]|nr:hypothetical protein [Parvicella tangerina]
MISFLFLLGTLSISGQSNHKNYWSIGILAGHSAPNFSHDNHPWKGSFYPTGELLVNFEHRLNRQLSLENGIGIAAYALVNRGPQDRYTLDFAAPHIFSGIKFRGDRSLRNWTPVIHAHLGCQLGYKGVIDENFQTYAVSIKGNPLIPYLRLKTGIQSKPVRIQRKAFLELGFGTFFRYNFIPLGTVHLLGSDYAVDLTPSGNVIGVYLDIAFAMGKKKLPIIDKDHGTENMTKGRF